MSCWLYGTSWVWPTARLNGLHRPHQGWPSGHVHFTEEVSVGFQCHAGVTLAATLLNRLPLSPCLPQHPYPLCPHICLTPFPSPVCALAAIMAQCAPRPFVLCFTAVNVTWVTLSLLSTDGPLFATLLKRPPLAFHVFSFLLCDREPFPSIFTQPYDNTHNFPANARISSPISYFCFSLDFAKLWCCLHLSKHTRQL